MPTSKFLQGIDKHFLPNEDAQPEDEEKPSATVSPESYSEQFYAN